MLEGVKAVEFHAVHELAALLGGFCILHKNDAILENDI